MENEKNNEVINLGAKSQIDKTVSALNNADITPAIAAQLIPDSEFPVITETIDLPSGGVFYPDGQSQITVKQLTTDEEDILTSESLIRAETVLDVLLDSSIINSDLNSENMIIGDKTFVLLYLRKEGYGDEYDVKMSCPECSESFKNTVLLSNLVAKKLTVKPGADGLFSVKLPKTSWDVKFRMFTGKDEAFLVKKLKVQKKSKTGQSYSKGLTERYLLQIMSINGKTDKLDIQTAVSRMPISDSLFLREFINEVSPGVNMEHDFTCTKCGHTYVEDVPIRANLFWPNAKV